MTAARGDAVVDVLGLTVTYGSIVAVRDVSFHVGSGEAVGIVGPNGAGKTTLLRAISGLVRPTSGTVRVGGEPPPSRGRLAYVPQTGEIDWEYPATVADVAAMGRWPHLGRSRRLRPGDRAAVDDVLARLGLAALADRPIGTLSGGQRQRVLLARALTQQAGLLLLDEPFSGVDALTLEVLWAELHRLRSAGATVVVVNHDLASVTTAYDRLIVLAQRLVADGPVAEVFTAEALAEAYGRTPLLGPPSASREREAG